MKSRSFAALRMTIKKIPAGPNWFLLRYEKPARHVASSFSNTVLGNKARNSSAAFLSSPVILRRRRDWRYSMQPVPAVLGITEESPGDQERTHAQNRNYRRRAIGVAAGVGPAAEQV